MYFEYFIRVKIEPNVWPKIFNCYINFKCFQDKRFCISAALTVPTLFSDGMVLQGAPGRAQVWGSLAGVDKPVSLNIKCQSGYLHNFTAINVRPFVLRYFN